MKHDFYNDGNKFEVGSVVCAPSTDGVLFDTTASGAVLLLKMQRPTRKEVREFKNGRAKFRFIVKNGIIFFLSKFGTLPWMDAPYHWMYAHFDGGWMEFPVEGTGIALHTMLIDAATGVLVAQKLIGLPTDFSRRLITAIQNQPEVKNYYQQAGWVQAMWTTEQLVKESEHENTHSH